MPAGVPHTLSRTPIANTGGCKRTLFARDYGDLVFQVKKALVAVGGLNEGSKTVNWRRWLAVITGFQAWATARGVSREDRQFGTAKDGVFTRIIQNQMSRHPEHWVWVAGTIATLLASSTFQNMDYTMRVFA
jgi:hypothetical protein